MKDILGEIKIHYGFPIDVELTKGCKERKGRFGIVRTGGRIKIITGEEVDAELAKTMEKTEQDVRELTGMVACKGYMEGIVKVVEDAQYISKSNKGEILVANETMPDFVVVMKKAGAIITNQGGITSHAAIISRELEIPCIIGTKITTQVLKDGDEVEVDANVGLVTVLQRAREGN